MGHKAYDCFAVEIYKGHELIRTTGFNEIREAVSFATDWESKGYRCTINTADKYLVVVERID